MGTRASSEAPAPVAPAMLLKLLSPIPCPTSPPGMWGQWESRCVGECTFMYACLLEYVCVHTGRPMCVCVCVRACVFVCVCVCQQADWEVDERNSGLALFDDEAWTQNEETLETWNTFVTNRCCLTRDEDALYRQDTGPSNDLVPAAPAPTPTAASLEDDHEGAGVGAHTKTLGRTHTWPQTAVAGSANGPGDSISPGFRIPSEVGSKRSKWEKCAGLRARVALQMLGMLDKLMAKNKNEEGEDILAAAQGILAAAEGGGEGGIAPSMVAGEAGKMQ